MLVRDAGESWQLVLQPDHADLSGQLARAWGGEGFARPEPFDSVVLAATRHDDGWAVWERHPRLGADGAPQSFFTVPVPVHLAFYRACVEVVCEQDPYAGLLVSMHMSGLYRARYGVMPAAPMALTDEARALADAFCEQEEARQDALAHQLAVDEAQRWTNYALLQVFDIVSLYFGLADLESGTEGSCEGVPTADGRRTRLAIAPLGPRRVRLDPFPFLTSPTVLTLPRRLVRKRPWAGDGELRRDLAAATVETLRIVAER
jgi:Protein of unknown function (DUF3891)